MNVSNLVKKARTALRENRRFVVVTVLILFFTVDAMGVYALSRPAGIKLPADAEMSFFGGGRAYKLSYHGSMYYTCENLPEKAAATLKGCRIGMLPLLDNGQDYSTAGNVEVYTVRGYSKENRLIGVYSTPSKEACGTLFFSFSGMTVKEGADFLKKLDLKNNTREATYLKNVKTGTKNVKVNPILWNRFINALYSAKPEEYRQPMYKLPGIKLLQSTSRDGVVDALTLYEDGYVMVNNTRIVLKVDTLAFNEFWDSLK